MNKSSYWLTIHSTVKKQNKKTHKNLAEYVVEPSNTCSREPTQLPIENTDMVISLPCLKIFHVIPLSRKWSPKSSNKHFTIWLIYLSVPPSSTCQTLPSSQWGLYFQDCCFSFFFWNTLLLSSLARPCPFFRAQLKYYFFFEAFPRQNELFCSYSPIFRMLCITFFIIRCLCVSPALEWGREVGWK